MALKRRLTPQPVPASLPEMSSSSATRPFRLFLYAVGMAVVMYTAAYHSYQSVATSTGRNNASILSDASSSILSIVPSGLLHNSTGTTDTPHQVQVLHAQVESLQEELAKRDQQIQELTEKLQVKGTTSTSTISALSTTQSTTTPEATQPTTTTSTTTSTSTTTAEAISTSTHHNNPNPHSSNNHTSRTHVPFVPPRKLLPSELNLPTPIIVMGLQKAGTTSIYGYFTCGMEGRLSHYDCKPPKNNPNGDKYGMACGKKLLINKEQLPDKPLFYEMGDWDLYAELDSPHRSPKRGIILPQWQWIQDIHNAHPNATWILNTRSPIQWVKSIDKWHDLRQRFVNTDFPPEFPKGKGTTDPEMVDFYNTQAQRIRDFVTADPSHHHHLVEVQIDSPDAGQVMEQAFGITQQCWGNKNHNHGDAKWTPN